MTGSLYLPNVQIFQAQNTAYVGQESPDSGQRAVPERENLMENIRTNAIGCTPLTSKKLMKHTLLREHIPCSFLESPVPIFYNENVEISKGGGVR
jgi:hypothetical protein